MTQIYFAYNPYTKLVKIGRTDRWLNQRQRALRWEFGRRVFMLAAIPVIDPAAEQVIHAYFFNQRAGVKYGREWFDIDRKDVSSFLVAWAADGGRSIMKSFGKSLDRFEKRKAEYRRERNLILKLAQISSDARAELPETLKELGDRMGFRARVRKSA